MTYQSPAQRAILRNREYPYQVSIKRFKLAVDCYQMPTLQDIMINYSKAQHWQSYRNVDGDHTRVFGFRTEEELVAFKAAMPATKD